MKVVYKGLGRISAGDIPAFMRGDFPIQFHVQFGCAAYGLVGCVLCLRRHRRMRHVWRSTQRLRCQYLYFCASEASKLSTCGACEVSVFVLLH